MFKAATHDDDGSSLDPKRAAMGFAIDPCRPPGEDGQAGLGQEGGETTRLFAAIGGATAGADDGEGEAVFGTEVATNPKGGGGPSGKGGRFGGKRNWTWGPRDRLAALAGISVEGLDPYILWFGLQGQVGTG